jgi:flagellar biosynthesis chaperone FliJ
MTRARLISLQRQLKHLEDVIQKLVAELHFAKQTQAAESLWMAVQPIKDTRAIMRDLVATEFEIKSRARK